MQAAIFLKNDSENALWIICSCLIYLFSLEFAPVSDNNHDDDDDDDDDKGAVLSPKQIRRYPNI